MTGKLFINGVDAYTQWGVVLEDGSLSKLLAGDSMKPYVENKSRAEAGKQILIKNPRLDERDVTLIFMFVPRSTSFLTRYASFLSTLQAGKVVETKIYPIELKVIDLNMTYRLVYEGSTNLTQLDLAIGKVAIKFNEPNPENRTL